MGNRIGTRSWIVGALVAGVVVGGGITSAAVPDAGGTISACVNARTGALRVIDVEAGQQCRREESALEWAQSSPTPMLVCPVGTTMSTGVCFDDLARAAATHGDAEDDCADEGRRLPSPGELVAFAALPGVALATGGEWSDDLADIATASAFKYFVIADPGNGVQGAFVPTAYRCVAAPMLG